MHYTKIGRASDLDDAKEISFYRFLETIPGLLAWTTLILMIILSFLKPAIVAIFVILFDVYWLIKTIYLSWHLRQAYAKMKDNLKIDWPSRLDKLQAISYKLRAINSWRDIYHLVILPMYKEDEAVVLASLEGLKKTAYPRDRLIVVLAQEERAKSDIGPMNEKLQAEYGHQFFRFLITEHPANLPGEMAGKGSNASFAARIAKEKIIDALGLKHEQVIVSNLDIDTVVSSHYFSLLTYLYLTIDDPLHASYQPIPLYTNNIWEAPALARVVAFSATFWHTIQQARPERLTTFSSHSMPFKVLVDVDFWQTNMVSEDSRIFWQCFLRYDGRYRVVPMFYPVSMDANLAPNFWQTMKNIYKQQRRWGYGAENIPYFLFGFYKNKFISWRKKWYYSFNILEGFHSWATNALIIFLLGWLPAVVGGPEFNQTVLSLNLPRFTRFIMTMAMVGLISSAVLSIVLLPTRPVRYPRHRYFWMILQWLLFPVTTILLGAIPGLEAQTRLMLGKYMGFWVTPKTRSKNLESRI